MTGMVTDNLTNAPNTLDGQRIAVLLEYNGSSFAGSQFQSQGTVILPTVQHALQQALERLQLGASVPILSGRTDAGVHARGQVAHFDLPVDGLRNIPGSLATSLNAVLPQGVAVRGVKLDVDPRFHSQLSAQYRWYRYTVYNAPQRSVWSPSDSVWVKDPLNVDAMNDAVGYIQGTRDFKSFKCPDTHVRNDVCRVAHAQVHQDGSLVYFDIVANRFLYKMVRNLMGLLLSIGRGQCSPEQMLQALEARDRRRAGAIAPPEGLSLRAVAYPGELNYFSEDEDVQTLQQLVTYQSFQQLESMQDENLFRKAS